MGACCKSQDTWCLSGALSWSLCALSRSPTLGVSQLYCRLLPPWGGRSGSLRGRDYWMWSPWCIEAGQPQQVARTRWFTQRSVLEATAHICAYSDRYVQPLVHPGSHPGSVTKGVITLLKKGIRHVWEGLDDYISITLLNTDLKILARVLTNRLQVVISDTIGPEQTFAVKGRSIQDNLHLIREVQEGMKDGTEAAMISLDQSKTFDRVNQRFLATVLETAGFQPEFSMD